MCVEWSGMDLLRPTISILHPLILPWQQGWAEIMEDLDLFPRAELEQQGVGSLVEGGRIFQPAQHPPTPHTHSKVSHAHIRVM